MTLNFHSGRHMRVEVLTVPPANLLVHLAPRSVSEWCLSHSTDDGSCYPIVRGLMSKAQALALARAIPVGLGFGHPVEANSYFPTTRPWYQIEDEDRFNYLADTILAVQEPLQKHLGDRAKYIGCSISDFEVLGIHYDYGVCWMRDPLPYQYVFREGVWQTPKSVRYGVEMFTWNDGPKECLRFTVPEEMLPEFP